VTETSCRIAVTKKRRAVGVGGSSLVASTTYLGGNPVSVYYYPSPATGALNWDVSADGVNWSTYYTEAAGGGAVYYGPFDEGWPWMRMRLNADAAGGAWRWIETVYKTDRPQRGTFSRTLTSNPAGSVVGVPFRNQGAALVNCTAITTGAVGGFTSTVQLSNDGVTWVTAGVSWPDNPAASLSQRISPHSLWVRPVVTNDGNGPRDWKFMFSTYQRNRGDQ
jgi:hypothetical protein